MLISSSRRTAKKSRSILRRRVSSVPTSSSSDSLMPYDSLASNRGHDETNMYMMRNKKERKSLRFNDDPMKASNAPPWMTNAKTRTMADERKELLGGRDGGIHDTDDDYERGGLTRDDKHSEFGGANMFARAKKRREERAQRFGYKRGKHRQKFGKGIGLAGRTRR